MRNREESNKTHQSEPAADVIGKSVEIIKHKTKQILWLLSIDPGGAITLFAIQISEGGRAWLPRFFLNALEYIPRLMPRVPHYVRVASSEIMNVMHWQDFSAGIQAAQNIKKRLTIVEKFYFTPVAINHYERLVLSGSGRVPESIFYEMGKDVLFMTQIIREIRAGKLLRGVAILDGAFGFVNTIRNLANIESIRRSIQAVRARYARKEIEAAISNVSVLSREGYYEAALERVDDLLDNITDLAASGIDINAFYLKLRVIHYQTCIRLTIANLSNAGDQVNESVHEHIDQLLRTAEQDFQGSEKDSICAWTKWHRAAILLREGKTHKAKGEMEYLTSGNSPYRLQASQWLARHYLQEGKGLQAMTWLHRACEEERQEEWERLPTIVQNATQYVSAHVRLLNAETEHERYELTKLGYASSLFAGSIASVFYMNAKVIAYAPPFLLDLVFRDASHQRTASCNRKQEYTDGLASILNSPSTRNEDNPSAFSPFQYYVQPILNSCSSFFDSAPDPLQNEIKSVLSSYTSENRWFEKPSPDHENHNDFVGIRDQFYEVLEKIKRDWKNRVLCRVHFSELSEIYLFLVELPSALVKAFQEDIFFLCFDIFTSQRDANTEEFKTLIDCFNRAFPFGNTLSGKLLRVFRTFPTAQKYGKADNSIWLFSEFLWPDNDLSIDAIAENLRHYFGNKHLDKDSLYDFILMKAESGQALNKMDRFTLGLACALLGIVDKEMRREFLDLALSKFSLIPFLKHWSYAKLANSSKDKAGDWSQYNAILAQYDFDQECILSLLEFYEMIESSNGLSLKDLRSIIREMISPFKIDKEFMTHISSETIDHEEIERLLRAGADPNSSINEVTVKKENTSLFWDKVTQQTEVVEYPLHIACRKLDPDLVKVLIDYGAETSVLNKEGKKAFQLLTGTNSTQENAIKRLFEKVGVMTDVAPDNSDETLPCMHH